MRYPGLPIVWRLDGDEEDIADAAAREGVELTRSSPRGRVGDHLPRYPAAGSACARALGRKGLSAVEGSSGLDVRSVRMHADSLERVGEYIAKVGFEITSPSTKDGRHGNRAPFAILRDALATGLADDCELWLEWEEASHGRRQLTWSQGLREWARLGCEATDEEIVEEDQHGNDALILPPETWDAVRDRVSELLDAAEVGGVAGAMRWLDRQGLRWFCPDRHRTGPPPGHSIAGR